MLVNKVSYRHSFVSGEGYVTLVIESPHGLMSVWTPELQQDLQVYYNLDVEQELTNLLTQEITRQIDNQIMSDIRQQTINRWEETGLLDGINNDTTRQNMAELFEGQAARLLREENDDTPVINMNLESRLVETQIRPLRFLGEDETGEDVDTPVFPIVRRVFSQMLANDIVAVQPMEAPRGELVYFTPNPINDVIWLTDGESWKCGSLYTHNIGISMDLKPLKFK